jgi:putative acyl-CoA dehydrogenase
MEVLGGIGYCEESELPRLYREMPVNSIWEGSGNIMCLDVMRVLSKQPAALELLAAECAEVKGQNRHFDRAWRQLQQLLNGPPKSRERLPGWSIVWARGRRCCATLRRRWLKPGAG